MASRSDTRLLSGRLSSGTDADPLAQGGQPAQVVHPLLGRGRKAAGLPHHPHEPAAEAEGRPAVVLAAVHQVMEYA